MILAFFGTPGGGELLLVLLAVLLLFGAKNLPRMARTLGRTLEEFRRAAREVTDEIVHADEDDDLKRPRSVVGAKQVEDGAASAPQKTDSQPVKSASVDSINPDSSSKRGSS